MLCFERFYKSVNCDAGHLQYVKNRGQYRLSQSTCIQTFDTIGVSYLWKVIMTANDAVVERAIDLIHDVYGSWDFWREIFVVIM